MTQRTLRFLTIALTLAISACGASMTMEVTITQDEAAERVTEHINNAMSALPDTAELEKRHGMNFASCDDPTDGGPKNRITVSERFWIRGFPVEDNEHNAELLHAYWTSNGYRILRDERPDKLTIAAEHEEDAFRMSIRFNDQGDFSLGASSPCVWPEGTPNP